jgi:hypothetical protein
MKRDDEPVRTYIPTKDNKVLETFWHTGETIEIVTKGVINVWCQFYVYGLKNYIQRDMKEFVN